LLAVVGLEPGDIDEEIVDEIDKVIEDGEAAEEQS
jgi:hypothetical protein